MTNNSNQNPKHSSATSTSELPWLAFCYVANELDSETRREFEIRLEHDQIAREAVAEAFDSARLLDQALTQETGETLDGCSELKQPESRKTAGSSLAKSKSVWPAALLGIAIAGLLAIVLLQSRTKPEVEVAQNAGSPTQSELTDTSISLAEAWADSDWDAEFGDIVDVDTNLTQPQNSDLTSELAQDDEDDWMTATLIDMAEDLDVVPQQSCRQLIQIILKSKSCFAGCRF